MHAPRSGRSGTTDPGVGGDRPGRRRVTVLRQAARAPRLRARVLHPPPVRRVVSEHDPHRRLPRTAAPRRDVRRRLPLRALPPTVRDGGGGVVGRRVGRCLPHGRRALRRARHPTAGGVRQVEPVGGAARPLQVLLRSPGSPATTRARRLRSLRSAVRRALVRALSGPSSPARPVPSLIARRLRPPMATDRSGVVASGVGRYGRRRRLVEAVDHRPRRQPLRRCAKARLVHRVEHPSLEVEV